MTVVFGGNRFAAGTVVPLAMGDRYVLVEPSGEAVPYISVVRDFGGTPMFEVFRNEPNEGEGFTTSRTPPGIVTVVDSSDRFEYKVRPASETSVVFGTLRGEQLEARISDTAIQVAGVTVRRNDFVGPQVGVKVDENGGIAISAPIPPGLIELLDPPTT